MNSKQLKKYGRIFASIILCIFSLQQKVVAQADFRNDNYIAVKNLWKDTNSKSALYKLPLLPEKKVDSIVLSMLPILNKIQLVQDHPYNWNDGSMVPSKGLQHFTRVGVNAQWKFLEAQFAPEIVLAQNQNFEEFPLDMDQIHWKDYYRFYNLIELPNRMGAKQYSQFLLGQSFLKLHYKKLAVSLSTENKWWGPGQRNALFLSTNAAGFPHVSFASEQPLNTKIGKFEFEIISGKIYNGGWTPASPFKTFNGNKLYAPKPYNDRWISGFTLSYQPKWIPNLTVGLEQMYMQYYKEMNRWQDFFPVKNIFTSIPDDRINKPILLTGTYFTYEMPEADVIMYGEFGWNLNNTSFRNWIIQPDKGFASILGVKKILRSKHSYYWEILGEMSQLQLLTRAEQFTNAEPPSWYLGANVRQGFTNDGQLLGAGVGPGGSSQTVEFNWREKQNRIGIAVERRVHNNDFYEYTFAGSQDFRRFYVDFATTLKLDWQYKKWQFGPRLSYIRTNNFNWWLYQPQDIYFITGRDVNQIVGQLNFQYKL